MKKGTTMTKQLKQYAVFLIGLFIAALGVAFSTKAGLGTSPVASVPYSVSLVNQSLSFGWWMIIMSLVQILVQVLILRKKCKPFEILVQVVVAFVYGSLTDFCCGLLQGLNPVSYPARFALMLVGCVILGLGIWIQYKGGVAMLAGEAMNRAISQVTGKRYENIKIFFDVFYIVVSGIISLVFLGKFAGVREGSVIAALLIGNIIKLINKLYNRYFKKA